MYVHTRVFLTLEILWPLSKNNLDEKSSHCNKHFAKYYQVTLVHKIQFKY